MARQSIFDMKVSKVYLLGWENLGNVLGAGKEAEALALGASIK